VHIQAWFDCVGDCCDNSNVFLFLFSPQGNFYRKHHDMNSEMRRFPPTLATKEQQTANLLLTPAREMKRKEKKATQSKQLLTSSIGAARPGYKVAMLGSACGKDPSGSACGSARTYSAALAIQRHVRIEEEN
jgi:hypothetical protein